MSADERREYNRIKQAEWRKENVKPASTTVNDKREKSNMSALSAHPEAASKAEAEANPFRSGVSASVQAINNRTALERVEKRLSVLRGQMPFTKGDPRCQEVISQKAERTRLMEQLGFKA